MRVSMSHFVKEIAAPRTKSSKRPPLEPGKRKYRTIDAILGLGVFKGGPLLQLFDGTFTGIDNGEKLGDDGLEFRFTEICPKCLTESFRVVLDEECKLTKPFSSVFEWESFTVIVSQK